MAKRVFDMDPRSPTYRTWVPTIDMSAFRIPVVDDRHLHATYLSEFTAVVDSGIPVASMWLLVTPTQIAGPVRDKAGHVTVRIVERRNGHA